MPAVAVVGIFVSGAALATGTLGTMATIAAIGTIISSIGVLTENKTLATIGAVASLAGGVGAFAQGQGWLATGETASALGDTGSTSNTMAMAEASGMGVDAAAPVVDTGAVTGAVDATGATQSVIDQAAPAITTADNITQTSALAQPDGLMNAGSMNPAAPATVDAASSAPMLSKPQLDGTNVFGANSAPGAAPGSTATGSIFDTLKGGFDSIFRNPDGTLNKDMLSMTGKFIGGMFDEKTEAETDYYKAKTEELNFQMANGQNVPYVPMKLNGSVTFNKNAPTYKAPRVGSLYNAR